MNRTMRTTTMNRVTRRRGLGTVTYARKLMKQEGLLAKQLKRRAANKMARQSRKANR